MRLLIGLLMVSIILTAPTVLTVMQTITSGDTTTTCQPISFFDFKPAFACAHGGAIKVWNATNLGADITDSYVPHPLSSLIPSLPFTGFSDAALSAPHIALLPKGIPAPAVLITSYNGSFSSVISNLLTHPQDTTGSVKNQVDFTNNSMVLVGDANGKIFTWSNSNTFTFTPGAVLSEHTSAITHIQSGKNISISLSKSDGKLVIWKIVDSQTIKKCNSMTLTSPSAAAVSTDDRVISVGYLNGKLEIYKMVGDC